MKHFPWRECGWAMLAIVLLAGLYAGSYFAASEPNCVSLAEDGAISPTYWLNEEWVHTFYAPMFAVDRTLIREREWSETFARAGPPGR